MAITLPYTFVNGTVIRASEMNANFATLANAVNGSGGGGGDGITLPLAVASGGTGATTAIQARSNLGIPTPVPVPVPVVQGGTGQTNFPQTPSMFDFPNLGWDYWNIAGLLRGIGSSIDNSYINWITQGGAGNQAWGTIGTWGQGTGNLCLVVIGNAPYIASARANGTPTAPTSPQAGQDVLDIAAGGYVGLKPNGERWDTWTGWIAFIAKENYSPTSHATFAEVATTDYGVGGNPYRTHYFDFSHEGNFSIEGQFRSPFNSIGTPSDPRLKESVEPFTRGLADLMKLEPCTYCYNGRAREAPKNGRRCIGLEAEKVQDIMPEMVGTMQIKLDPQPRQIPDVNNPDIPHELPDTDILTLNSGDLTFLLINAVKELSERLDQLEAKGSA
jgi:hypothetical protein